MEMNLSEAEKQAIFNLVQCAMNRMMFVYGDMTMEEAWNKYVGTHLNFDSVSSVVEGMMEEKEE